MPYNWKQYFKNITLKRGDNPKHDIYAFFYKIWPKSVIWCQASPSALCAVSLISALWSEWVPTVLSPYAEYMAVIYAGITH